MHPTMIAGLDPNTARAQDVFDFVAFKLIQQGKPSVTADGAKCLYRDGNGGKCAAGHLIPDEEYRPVIEGMGIAFCAERVPALAALVRHGLDLLLDLLQQAHDDAARDHADTWLASWRSNMSGVARLHNLDASILAYRA